MYYGVPQSSVRGPVFFNINLIDVFYLYENSDIESCADDTTPNTCAPDTDTVISKLHSTFDKHFTWFKVNHVKTNPEICHLLLSSKIPTKSLFGTSCIKSSTKETLLGVLIDSKLRFNEHMSLICTKVGRKINALGHITNLRI